MAHNQQRKLWALLLSIIMLANTLALPPLWAEEGEQPELVTTQTNPFWIEDNGFIAYRIRNSDGAFSILPSSHPFDESKPLSQALFRIDGQTYRFGEILADGSSSLLPPFKNDSGTVQTTWICRSLAITQYLNIIQDEGNSDSYAVFVGYDAQNQAGEAVALDMRLVIDTQFGAEDDQPITLSGGNRFISNEASYTVLPSSFRMDEYISNPPLAYGILQDSRFTAPDAITFGHLLNLIDGGFDYTAEETLDFTSSANRYGCSDSALALSFADIDIADAQPWGTIIGFSGQPTPANPETVGSNPGDPSAAAKAAGFAAAATAVPVSSQFNLLSDEPVSRIPQGASGDTYDGVDIADLLNTAEGRGFYFGSYKHCLPFGYYGLAYEANPTPVLWRVMGEELIHENELAYGDGAITALSEYVVDVAAFEEDASENGNPYLFYDESSIDVKLGTMEDELFHSSELQSAADVSVVTKLLERKLGEAGSGVVYMEEVTGDVYQMVINSSVIESGDFISAYPRSAEKRKLYLPWGYHQEDPVSGGSAHSIVSVDARMHDVSLEQSSPMCLGVGMTHIASNVLSKDQIGTGNFYNYWLRNPIYRHPLDDDAPFGKIDKTAVGVFFQVGSSVSDAATDVALFSSGKSVGEKQGIRPVFKLDPTTIVFASEILDDVSAVAYATQAVESHYYDQRIGGGKNFKLTVLGGNNGADVGTLSGLPDKKHVYTIHGTTGVEQFTYQVTAGPANNTDDYTINYKIVAATDAGGREIIQYGSFPVADGSVSWSTADLQSFVEYDAYVWLQRNNAANSHETSAVHHFPLEIQRGYDVTRLPLPAGSSFSIVTGSGETPSGDFLCLPGETVTIKEIVIPDPDNNRFLLHAFGVVGGARSNVELTAKDDGSFGFTMPAMDIELSLQYFAKDNLIVSVGRSAYANVTLDRYYGRPGDTLQLQSQQIDPAYYAATAVVYKTYYDFGFDERGNANVLSRYEEFERVSFNDNAKQSFTIPADFGEQDIYIGIEAAKVPRNKIIVTPSTLSLDPSNYTGNPEDAKYATEYPLSLSSRTGQWQKDAVAYSSSDFAPGYTLNLHLTTDRAYWSFDIVSVKQGDVDFAYTATVSEQAGKKSVDLSIALPAFMVPDEFNADDITIRLEAKKIYQPMSVQGISADAGAYVNATTLTVTGTELEQVLGKGPNVTLLTAEQQAVMTKVYFGSGADPNDASTCILLDPSAISVSEDDSTLSLDISAAKTALGEIDSSQGSIFYLILGGTAYSVHLDTDYRLRYAPFSILGVVSDDDHHHSIILADNDTDLIQKRGEKTLLLTLKGQVSSPASGTFQFGQGKVLFNTSLVYQLSGSDTLSLHESNGTVELSGSGGKLSVPGFQFGKDVRLHSEFTAGSQYVVDKYVESGVNIDNVIIDWGDSLSDALDIAANFGMAFKVNSFRLIDKSVVFGGTMSIGIPFASANFVGIDVERLQYAMDGQGQSVFEGVVAEGGISWPDSFSLADFMDMGNGVTVRVDTFSNSYQFEVDVNIQILQFEGKLYLAETSQGWLVPDLFNIYMAGEPGVVIIPTIPVGSLKGIGGGFSGLADTIGGNFNAIPPVMLNLQAAVEFAQILGINKAELSIGPSGIHLKGNPVIGKGNFKVQPFSRFEAGLNVSSRQVDLYAAVEAKIVPGFEVFVAGGEIYLAYRFPTSASGIFNPDNFTFSGRLYGRLQVPSFKIGPFNVGPFIFTNMEMGVNNTGVFASFRVLNKNIKVGFDWDKKTPEISLFRLLPSEPQPGDSLATEQSFYDDEGEYAGTMHIGGNLRLRDSYTAAPQRLRSFGVTNVAYELKLEAPLAETDLVLVAVDRAALRVYYSTDDWTTETLYSLYYPHEQGASAPHTGYELDGDFNALDFSTDAEMSIMLKLNLPDGANAKWKIVNTAGLEFSYSVIEVEPLPELTAPTFDPSDKSLTWSAENLDSEAEYLLDIFLSPDNASVADPSTGYPLLQNKAITVTNGTASGVLNNGSDYDFTKLPIDLASGDYYLWAFLKESLGEREVLDIDGEELIDPETQSVLKETYYEIHDFRCDSTQAYKHTNPLQPSSVSSLSVRSIGNGALEASWTSVDTVNKDVYYQIVAYYLDADDKPSSLVVNAGGQTGRAEDIEDEADAEWLVDLSLEPLTYTVAPESEENGSFTAVLSGLPLNKEMKLAIQPYRYSDLGEEGDAHRSAPILAAETLSNQILLPIPRYPHLNLDVGDAFTSTDAKNNLSVFTSDALNIVVSSDQDCVFSLLVNGTEVERTTSNVTKYSYSLAADAANPVRSLHIEAKSHAGDISRLAFTAVLDTEAPVLFIEGLTDGALVADSQGRFNIAGSTQPRAQVSLYTADLSSVQAEENGRFNVAGILSAEQQASDLNDRLVTVASRDAVGNTVTANVRVLTMNEAAEQLQSINITPTGSIQFRSNEWISIGAWLNTADPAKKQQVSGSSLRYQIVSGSDVIAIDESTGQTSARKTGTAVVKVHFTDSLERTFSSDELHITVVAPPVSSSYIPPNNSSSATKDVYQQDLSLLVEGQRIRVQEQNHGQKAVLSLSGQALSALKNAAADRIRFDIASISSATEIQLARSLVLGLAESGKSIVINTVYGEIALDSEAALDAAAQLGLNISFEIVPVDFATLSAKQQADLQGVTSETSMLYSVRIFSVSGGQTTELHQYLGSVTISFHQEFPEAFGLWCWDEEENFAELAWSIDATSGSILFQAPHLSLFAIGPKIVAPPVVAEGKDISSETYTEPQPSSPVPIVLHIGSRQVSQGEAKLPEAPLAPAILNGRTMLPFRYLIQTLLGGEVDYDEVTRLITASVNGHRFDMVPDRLDIVIDDQSQQFGQAPVVIDGHTLVPLRAFESVVEELLWDEAAQTVTIIPLAPDLP